MYIGESMVIGVSRLLSCSSTDSVLYAMIDSVTLIKGVAVIHVGVHEKVISAGGEISERLKRDVYRREIGGRLSRRRSKQRDGRVASATTSSATTTRKLIRTS